LAIARFRGMGAASVETAKDRMMMDLNIV
jgi:hypothetical protein